MSNIQKRISDVPSLNAIHESRIPNTLALPKPEKVTFSPEVNKLANSLIKYGIDNELGKAARKAKEKHTKEHRRKKEEYAFALVGSGLAQEMFPFSVIDFPTFHKVCEDHELLFTHISKFNKGIPEHAIASMDTFAEKLEVLGVKDKDNIFEIAIKEEGVAIGGHYQDLKYADFKDIIFIAAKGGNFDFKPGDEQIGQEVFHVPRAKRDYSSLGKLHRVKMPTFDPIVFSAIKVSGKIYITVIDGWGEEFDDSRLRSHFVD